DSAAGANGRVVSGTMANGQMFLNGSSQFLNLPKNLISCLSEVSIEAWVTPSNYNGLYTRVFDFGSQRNDVGGLRGTSYLYLSPSGANFLIAAISTNDISGEKPRRLYRTNALPLSVQSHVAFTYSPIRGAMKLYVNGSTVDSDVPVIFLGQVNDTNCWLGKSE